METVLGVEFTSGAVAEWFSNWSVIKQKKTEIKLFSKGSELTTKRVWFVLLIANNRKRRALLVTVGFWI